MEIMIGILVFFPFLGGLACMMAGKRNETLRDWLAAAVTVIELGLMLAVFVLNREAVWQQSGVWNSAVASLHLKEVCGLGLNFQLDGFRLLYGLIAAFMWAMACLMSKEYLKHHENRNRFYLFLLLTLGATMGVFLSADLFTTFVFFEIMSFTSYVWVVQEEDRPSIQAAGTYLAVAVIGGLVMLMGIFMLYHELGTVTIDRLYEGVKQCENKGVIYGAGACMLVGFGAKAGAFPLHIWLPKAHPVAPAPASALLSGILTKTGIYGMLLLTANLFLHDGVWGALILALGTATMLGGALLAVFSMNLKRTLACSSMSQIGFIMVGIGMQGLLGEENGLAVHGTLLHMMNHSMIKLVLFLAAGVVFMNTHALDLNEIRGFGRKKPFLKGIFLIGALAIGGIPFFGGYVSKTLLHESIVEFGGGWLMKAVEYGFLFSGGLTVAYMTKLYMAVFAEPNASAKVQKKYDNQKRYMNTQSALVLGISAAVLLLWGLFPDSLMDRAARFGQGMMHLLETPESVSYFSLKNLSGAGISIGIGVIVYVFFIRKVLMEKTAGGDRYVNRWVSWLDVENLIYRPLLLGLLPLLGGLVCRVLDSFLDGVVVFLRKTIYRDSPLPHELTEGSLFTLSAGIILNRLRDVANSTWRRKRPIQRDYIHHLAVRRAESRQNSVVIRRSMSFALLLTCIGLMLTLFYLIILW